MIPQDAGKPDPISRLPLSPLDAAPVAGRIGEPPMRSYTTSPGGAAAAPPGLSAAPDMWSLLLALRQRWISAILLSVLLGTVTAGGVWYLLAPRNTAVARLRSAM